MSSSVLTTIQTQLNFYTYPLFLVFGNIGNALIIILFRGHLENGCSIYLFIEAIINEVYLTLSCFSQIFPIHYDDQNPGSLALCKLRIGVIHILGQISRTMLVLACVDRFFITSDRVRFRALSHPKRAKFFVISSAIFWSIFACHTLIMPTVMNGLCAAFGIYAKFYAFYSIIFVGLVPFILLVIFAYLTSRNMKQRHIRVQQTSQNGLAPNRVLQQRDYNLLILVIAEITVYFITTIPYPIISLERVISSYIISTKSVQYTVIENFIANVALLLLTVNNVASFYIYLFASKSFRRSFKQLIINVYRKLTRPPTVPVAFVTNIPLRAINRSSNVMK